VRFWAGNSQTVLTDRGEVMPRQVSNGPCRFSRLRATTATRLTRRSAWVGRRRGEERSVDWLECRSPTR
jgi:hypothetical protein